MRRVLGISFSAGILACASLFFFRNQSTDNSSRVDYEKFLRSHEYYEELRKGKSESEEEKRPDRPDLAYMQDFLLTMDPSLKRPLPESLYDLNRITALARDRRFTKTGRKTTTSLASATEWEERGPKKIGGRTRALLFDPADPQKKKVWAGGVTGGLWYNVDITNEDSGWIKVNDLWDNLSISCITDDPNNNKIMYVGTGEAHVGFRGAGIWKTIDGGETWTRLASTTTFLQVRDIDVRNENGTSVVYAAVHPVSDDDNPVYTGGLYRSANGGTTWTQVLPLVDGTYSNLPTDIEIDGDNELWVASKPNYFASSGNSTIYKSATGLAGSWSGTSTFGGSTYSGQIELGAAASNGNIVYAIIEEQSAVAGIFKTTNNGSSWASVSLPVDEDTDIPADDFTRGQAWYDLTIAVNPTNANEVIVGGIDLFKTSNGGTTWFQLSKWWSGIATTAPVVHADQHEILYRPGFPEHAIFGNDGGVYFGDNLNAGTSSASVLARNLNYNVTQFYSGALHPTLTNYMLGGTQDNGTQKFTQPGFGATIEADGGDGALSFIDQIDPSIQIISYVYNDISISKDGGQNFEQLLNDPNSGHFINYGEYDSNAKMLYLAKDDNSIYKIRVSQTDPIARLLIIPGLGSMVTALRASPYSTTQSNLIVGTQAGRVFKIQNATVTSPVITEITGASFPSGSISCIAFGASEDQMLVTFFNYGVPSVWETRDGGSTWVNKEGLVLPNMPVRWAEYHPHNRDQVFLATELGVWSTDNINVSNPIWLSTNGGLANVRTDMLRMRTSDGIMMASTHGRGVFTALIPSQLEQEITFSALPAKTFGDNNFTISASSTSGLPVTFSSSNPAIASLDGNTITIKAGGTVNIIANQAGNTYYKAATSVSQALVINKATQSITFAELPEVGIDESTLELTATASSNLPVTYTSSNTAIATVSGTTITIKGIGSTTITAKQAGDNNYLAAPDVQQTLTVVSRIINLSGDLNFGEVIIGEKQSRDLTITNSGTASVSVTGITYPEGYSHTVSTTATAIIITLTFAPLQPEEYNGTVVVESNATSGINTIEISGTGISITDAENKLSESIELYPNPVQDWLTIEGSDFTKVKSITVTSGDGKAFTVPAQGDGNELKVRVAEMKSGVYVIGIPVKNKIHFKKFTKN